MCINLYNSNYKIKDKDLMEEYELLKQIYTSIDKNDPITTKNFTQQLINLELKKGNKNISELEEALNNLQ